MNPMLTKLKSPLRRRLGRLVIELSDEGITLRGYRRHQGRTYTWEQIASLAADDFPLVRAAEKAAGTKVLSQLYRGRAK